MTNRKSAKPNPAPDIDSVDEFAASLSGMSRDELRETVEGLFVERRITELKAAKVMAELDLRSTPEEWS